MSYAAICAALREPVWLPSSMLIEAQIDRAFRVARRQRRAVFLIFTGRPRRGVVVLSRPRQGAFWTITPGGAVLGARP